MALSAKRRLWADEFVIDGNGERAAIAVGYSEKTARQIASKIKKDPAVARYIVSQMAKITARAELKAGDVLEGLANIAFSDPGDVYKFEGHTVTLRDSEKLTPAQRRMISGVSETKDGIRIRFHDRVPALRDLGRYFGMFLDRLDVEEKNKIPWQAIKGLLAGEDVTVG